MMINPAVDKYLIDGCGRCKFGGTPQCKVHLWPKPMQLMRQMLLDLGLTEELKWGVPCYTHQHKNIVILAAFKGYCSLSFFQGALMKDPKKLLQAPGEHTQLNRIFKFTALEQVVKQAAQIKDFVTQAMAVSTQKIEKKAITKTIIPPEEWLRCIENQPALAKAFQALTPGRQRAYLLYFLGAKQSSTRLQRIKKLMPQILKGKGLND